MALGSHLAMSIGFFVGVIPSVILIFFTLREYDEYYQDKHFFYLLVVGLFGGIMTALMYYWSVFYLGENWTLMVLLSLIIGFAIFEILLFTIILSMKRFDGKYDLPYYGVVLGGSIAGVLGMFVVYAQLSEYDMSFQTALSIALMIPTLPMFYISIGAMVGFGIPQNKSFKYSGWAVVYKTIFNLILIFWMIAFFYWPERGWDLMIFGLAFAVSMYYYVTKYLLPQALPEHLRKHRRRAKRRAKRESN